MQELTQSAPRGSRVVISFIGRRNVGKSALVNALCGEEVSIVSDTAGTTTDAVAKNYELLPFGPVTFYDTAGLDDTGCSLSKARISAAGKILWRTDLAVVVTDERGFGAFEAKLIARLQEMKIPFITVANKVLNDTADISVSALENRNIDELKALIVSRIPSSFAEDKGLLYGLIKAGQKIALVTPIDASAPVKRLILPQVQAIREVLDAGACALVTQSMTADILALNPALVVTDSQVIKQVAAATPPPVPLTTFSILFARAKGDLKIFAAGAKQIEKLNNGDKVLIVEGCSHHAMDDDIARVKIPRLLQSFTGKELAFMYACGHDFSPDLERYALVIHCGACMLGRMEMMRRLTESTRRKVAITNYGMAISLCQGVLDRVLEPFKPEL